MRWIRYTGRLADALDAPTAEFLENAIPGLSAFRATPKQGGWGRSGPEVTVSAHGFEAAERLLRARGIAATWQQGWSRDKNRITPVDYPRTVAARQRHLHYMPELRGNRKPLPHQQVALEQFTATGGLLLDWYTGSGKTFTAILASLLHRSQYTGAPHRVIVVTNANLVGQWCDAYIDTLRPDVIRPVRVGTRNQYRVEPATDRQRIGGLEPFLIMDQISGRVVGGFKDRDAAVAVATQMEHGALALRPEMPKRHPDPRLRRLYALTETLDPAYDPWVVVISRALLPFKIDALLKWAPRTLIIDEAHNYTDSQRVEKDKATGQWVPVRSEAGCVAMLAQQASFVLALSATPIPDNPADYWSLLDYLDPGGFGYSFRPFAYRYLSASQGRYGVELGSPSNAAELIERTKPFRHQVVRADIAQHLPKVHFEFARMPTTELLSVAEGRKNLGREPVAPPQRAPGATKTARVTTALLEYRIALSAARKLPGIRSRVAALLQNDDKILLVYTRKVSAETAAKRLTADMQALETKLGRPFPVFLAHGDTPEEEFERVKAAFLAAPVAVLIGTIDAWAEGTDGMQHGVTRVMIPALPWSPYKIQQVCGRPDRLGYSGKTAERGVTIEFMFAEGTMDETLFTVIYDKLSAADAFLESSDIKNLAKVVGDEAAASEMSEEAILEALLNRIGAHDAAQEAITTADDIDFHFSPEARFLAAGEVTEMDPSRHDGRGPRGPDDEDDDDSEYL